MSDAEQKPTVGICCSGGGIRAASYALGCLQELDAQGLLRGEHRAEYISAVSGGSYMVGGFAAVQRSIQGDAAGSPGRARSHPEGPAPYSVASPEYRRLRNRLGYLTHGPGGLGPELWRVVLGIAINIAALVALVATVARPVGWLYGWSIPSLRTGCTGVAGGPSVGHVSPGFFAEAGCATARFTTPTWAWQVLGVIVAWAVGTALYAALRRSGGRPSEWRYSFAMLAGAALWATAVWALPQLLAWIARANANVDPNPATVTQVGESFRWVPLGGLSGVLVALIGVAGPVWRVLAPGRKPSGKTDSGGASWLKRVIGWAWTKHRTTLLNGLAMLTGPLLLGGLFVWFASRGAATPPWVDGFNTARELWWWTGPAVALGVLVAVADVNTWSLHSLYRQRLGDAFDVERVASEPPVTPSSVPFAPITYPQPESPTAIGALDARSRRVPLPLVDAQPADFPSVLVCATANLSDYGTTPTDQKAAPFLFSAGQVGGPATGAMDTSEYVSRVWGNRGGLSLIDSVSISGAAVAPSMGKMTRAPLRFLLALANVRLGVWVPNPTRVPVETRPGRLFRKPGLSHLFREMLGVNPRKGRFIYVSDGGHYDNLGLVELLARRCDWIWAIDASGDSIDTFSTLGQALAIARAELGITVDIDPTEMAPTDDDPDHVRSTFCRGVIHYPARPSASGDPSAPDLPAKDATLIVVKAGVPADAPWNVEGFHRSNPRFPCDPTTDQLYGAPRFDAYVALGNFSMRQAWQRWGSDLEILQGRNTGPVTSLYEASALSAPARFAAPPPA